MGATEAPAQTLQDPPVPILNRAARPLIALCASSVALGLAAGPADAASKTTSTATVAKAKAKTKAKAKAKKTKAKKAKADLTVKALRLDLTTDGTLSVAANLLNQGNLFAKSSTVAIVLSDDTTFSDDDEVLDELDYTRVGAGVRRAISDEVDIPLDVDPSVDWNVLVCADSDGVVAEKSESNNCVSQEITLDDLAGDDSIDEEDSSADDGSADDSSAADDGSDQADSSGDDW